MWATLLKTMKIQFTKYHPRFAHDIGDEVVLMKEDAEHLLKEGYAIPAKSEPETAIANKYTEKRKAK